MQCKCPFIISVFCSTEVVPNVSIRLIGGANDTEGRVEVYYNKLWGTICDDDWDIQDARVVCRQLGYAVAISAPLRAAYGQGSGTIWLDNMECKGDENSIAECLHGGWGVENCHHGEDASVICTGLCRLCIPISFHFTQTGSFLLCCLLW